MFRKILIAAMFATAAGYCFADAGLPQVVTSEVFYDEDNDVVASFVNRKIKELSHHCGSLMGQRYELICNVATH